MFNKLERKGNWKVLLLDREYLSELKQNQFIMEGDPLVTRNESQGFGRYKIKIYEDNNIQDDPKFSCKGRIRLTIFKDRILVIQKSCINQGNVSK